MTLSAKDRTITHPSGRVETFPTLAAVMTAWSKYQNEARGRQDGNAKDQRRQERREAGLR